MPSLVELQLLLYTCDAVQVVVAYPALYASRRSGCAIPTQGYAAHGSPVENEAISFLLQGQDAQAVSFWVPGEKYKLAVSGIADVHAWVHASVGSVDAEGGGAQASACSNAWHSDATAEQHVVQWVAPGNSAVGAEGGCVVFTAAEAAGSRAEYSTNSVRTHNIEVDKF